MESRRRGGRGRALHPQGDAPGHLQPEHPPGPSPQEFGSQGPAPAGHTAFLLHSLVFVSLVASTAVSGATCHRALLTDCGRLVTTLTLGCSTRSPRPHPTVLQGPRGADPKKQGPSQLGTQGPGAPGVGVVGGWMPFRVCP